MLIPMEACMGHPIVVEQGAEFIIPFFRVISVDSTDKLSPPFAYLRISCPSAAILTYNNLRTLPEWKNFDWDAIADKSENYIAASKLEEYYEAICCREKSGQSVERQDELLLDCLYPQPVNNGDPPPLAVWYKKLIAEAEKYR